MLEKVHFVSNFLTNENTKNEFSLDALVKKFQF